jgi:transposase IS66 family protein
VLQCGIMSSVVTRKLPRISDFPPEEVTPAVLILLELCHYQQEQIQALRDEITRLKGQKPKPKIKPSKLESGKKGNPRPKGRGVRRGKRKKARELEIHKERCIAPEEIPKGSRFKGYEDFTVQDIELKVHNTRYRLERWETPEGDRLVGKLPPQVGGFHFGQTLRTYILYQYHHARVTQPLILEELREWGVEISAGQISAILIEGKEEFHAEKEELLRVGLQQSSYVHVDDTGARHQGKNGYCTHIGNEFFAYFASTGSKSRVNFLELLCAGCDEYTVNADALTYMKAQKLPKGPLDLLAGHDRKTACGMDEWLATLKGLGIEKAHHVRIATEGALLGTAIERGLNPDLVVISDDAGQFNVLLHALCWIHAERTLQKLVGFNDEQRAALENTRTQIWDFYQVLKEYKKAPSEAKKAEIEERFDEIFLQETRFTMLKLALRRLHKNKAELLLVLERPEIPLHNNLSEGDIREYVQKRKISGSTRSSEGRRCRDTFASLKKTCRKNGISFWQYLLDRIGGIHRIQPLEEWIFQQASPSSQALQPAVS